MADRRTRELAALRYVGWPPIACLLLATLVIGIAGITWINSPHWQHNPPAQARDVGTVPATPSVRPVLLAVPLIDPNRIEIPKLKAEAPIVPVATTKDGELDVPLNPKKVGWWRYGAKPGAKRGTAILAGHINFSGVTGSMAHIGKLNPGDQVNVFGKHNADNRTEVRFRVTGVRTYHKTALPYKQIFDQQSVGRIVIVTCGGPFNASTGNYRDNIVVFAVPATT
ncbi:class F sortase [uncultured Jatrophihabitans sp.]|uniref:class F sortase n=1 Tax=uncultured Jatrophihabitans sp. TaxID=1610747 RepID=UPI0035C9A13E